MWFGAGVLAAEVPCGNKDEIDRRLPHRVTDIESLMSIRRG
jgi:hypothetical protein